MAEPMVTTVLTTFRNPKLLVRAIKSVLSQKFSDFRLSVYDDASGDDTESVVAKIAAGDSRITYHRHPTNVPRTSPFSRKMTGCFQISIQLVCRVSRLSHKLLSCRPA